jgi:O-acetylhomoserine/O-acetylserine sulfhydrylase-like pyridoxal-dependent enzyme
MMRLTTFLHGAILVLLFIAVYMLSSVVNMVYSADDIKSQLGNQRSRIIFLETVANELIRNCTMSVADFEQFAHIHTGKKIHWNERDNSASTSMLIVTKKNFCIEEIRFAWMF